MANACPHEIKEASNVLMPRYRTPSAKTAERKNNTLIAMHAIISVRNIEVVDAINDWRDCRLLFIWALANGGV